MTYINDFFSASDNFYPDLVLLVDNFTLENFNFQKIGISSIIDDGVIYIRKGNILYKRIFESSINVKWFGAKGDGYTDDTTSIQECIDTAYALNPRRDIIGGFFISSIPIYFPLGKYIISDKIILQDGTILRGEDRNCVQIDSPNSDIIGFSTLREIQTDGKFIMSNQIGIENITFTQISIQLYGAVDSYVKNCYLFNYPTLPALELKLTTSLLIEDVHIYNSVLNSGISIIKDVGDGPNTTIRLNRVWISHCKIGIYVYGGNVYHNALDSSSFTGGIIEYCDIGVYLEGRVNNFYITDSHFEMLTEAALFSTADGTVTLSQVWFNSKNTDEHGNIVLESSNDQTEFQFNNVYSPIYVRNGYEGRILLYGIANIVQNLSAVTPISYQ